MSLHGNEPVFEVVEETSVDADETVVYDPDLEDDRDGEDK